MTTALQPIASMVSTFNNMNLAGVTPVTGGSRWTPPEARGVALGCTGIEFDPVGISWTNEAGQALTKPTLQFSWICLDGEFVGKEFKDEKYIISPRPTEPKPLKGWSFEMGRLLGVLQIIRGQDVPEGGLALALTEAMQIVTEAGQFPMKANIGKFTPAPTAKNPKPFEKTNVFAVEAIQTS